MFLIKFSLCSIPTTYFVYLFQDIFRGSKFLIFLFLSHILIRFIFCDSIWSCSDCLNNIIYITSSSVIWRGHTPMETSPISIPSGSLYGTNLIRSFFLNNVSWTEVNDCKLSSNKDLILVLALNIAQY